MPNYNLPKIPNDPNQPIPNDPFYAENSGKPYLEGPYSPILIGAGLEVCGDYLCSPSGEIPIPIGYLSQRGALISAVAPATPFTVLPGNPGQFLTVDLAEPAGMKWANAPTAVGCVSCSSFTQKGSILSASAPATPTALSSGPSGSVLQVDPTTLTGLRWLPNPWPTFTQKGQIAASDGVGTALPVSGTDGDILYYLQGCDTGWTAVQGCDFFIPQCGFERGTLVVGCGTNGSDKLPVGDDGYALVADSTCALGLKWANFSQNAKQTDGITFTVPSSTPAIPVTQLSVTSFPPGSRVYVSMTGSWYGNDETNYGCFYMQQGTNCSYIMCYSNESTGLIQDNKLSRFPFNISYIIPSWTGGFGNDLKFVIYKNETNPVTVQLQTAAFIIR